MTNNNTNLTQVETYYNEEKTKVKERYFVEENDLRQGMYKSFYENGKSINQFVYKKGKITEQKTILF